MTIIEPGERRHQLARARARCFGLKLVEDGTEFEGELSKIYLRWEYHGLGLGRRMMTETARRFLERGIHSFILFAELSNPTLAFYDRMQGERLLDDRGQFGGSYGWRDVRMLAEKLFVFLLLAVSAV